MTAPNLEREKNLLLHQSSAAGIPGEKKSEKPPASKARPWGEATVLTLRKDRG
jgi:hypothetical protein